jgi:cell division protein FtsB
LLVVLAVVGALYAQHTLSYFSTRSQADQQLAIVRHLSHENAMLLKEQASLNDPATIQRDARALGMVRPGERPYVITGLPGR